MMKPSRRRQETPLYLFTPWDEAWPMLALVSSHNVEFFRMPHDGRRGAVRTIRLGLAAALNLGSFKPLRRVNCPWTEEYREAVMAATAARILAVMERKATNGHPAPLTTNAL